MRTIYLHTHLCSTILLKDVTFCFVSNVNIVHYKAIQWALTLGFLFEVRISLGGCAVQWERRRLQGEGQKNKTDENAWHFWWNILVDNSQLLTISVCIYLYDSVSFCLSHHPLKYYWEWKDFSEIPQWYGFDLHPSFFRRLRCSSEALLMWSTGFTLFCGRGSNYPLILQVSVRMNHHYYQERLLLSISLERLHLVISNISTLKAIATQIPRQAYPVLWETTETESLCCHD